MNASNVPAPEPWMHSQLRRVPLAQPSVTGVAPVTLGLKLPLCYCNLLCNIFGVQQPQIM